MNQGPFTTVKARDLVKLYGTTRAILGVNVELHAGEVTVIEGPNGSGKSTLLSLLAQLAKPTRGTLEYGERPAEAWEPLELRAQIGVLAHTSMIYPDLSGLENLDFYAQLFGLDNPRQQRDVLVERFDIGRWATRPARTYSRGQLQRISIARALLHHPTLLLLDEPSTGLDQRAVERLEAVIAEERARGTIIGVITHDHRLGNRIADRRIRLDRGRTVEEG